MKFSGEVEPKFWTAPQASNASFPLVIRHKITVAQTLVQRESPYVISPSGYLAFAPPAIHAAITARS